MFSETKIILNENLSTRGYVSFYFNGKRYREYNGKKLNLDINPNNCKTYKDRLKFFKKLSFEFTKALENGWNPSENLDHLKNEERISLRDALQNILQEKLSSSLSSIYKRDLLKVIEQFLDFIPEDELNRHVREVNHRSVERFLNQFNTSATHYMNKRRILNVFFSELHRVKLITDNPVQNSLKKKQMATLHKVYGQEQLNAILNFLKLHYPNLHLCCLLAYGCFLRPHHESRLLQFRHIDEDFSKIRLSGEENKSRRVRVVNIPSYVQSVLRERLANITNQNTNIISLKDAPYNISYLNTQWSRAKKKLIKDGLIQKDQTIYSFRHTAAVNVYKKTKDLHILQKLLQHSNMIVTLNYLRGLGEINNDDLKDVLPEL